MTPQDPANLPPEYNAEAVELDAEERSGDATASMMESVLKETLRSWEASIGSAQGTDSLLVVARKFIGQPLALDPVATELIGTFLRRDFPRLAAVPELQEEISLQIARTMLNDSRQSALLAEFWTCLCERAS